MFARLKIWPLLCAIAAAAGCAHFEPQPLSPEKTAAHFDARRLDDAGLKNFLAQNSSAAPQTWPLEKWDLNSLTLAAFYFHPDLAVARAQWRVAQAGALTAGARPNPSVSASPGYDTQIPGNFSPWLIPVTFDIPIETAGKRAKRIAESQDSAKSAYWNLISAAWKIYADVRSSLLDFVVAGKRAELLNEQLSAQEKIEKLLQQRFDAGEISRPELTTTQITLNKLRLDASDAQTQCSVTRAKLAESLGVSASALNDVNFDIFNYSASTLDELTSADARRVALLGRGDIRGALADYAMAEDDLRLQVAKQYPDLHLGPGYAWNNGNAGDSQWSLGLTLELPILDQNQGPIAEAKARRELAAAQFTALQARVIGEIDRAVANFRSAYAQLKTVRSLFADEQRQQKSAEAQRMVGEADDLDLTSAQMQLKAAALAQLEGEMKFQTALGALEDALQSPADQLAAVIQKITSENPNGKASHP